MPKVKHGSRVEVLFNNTAIGVITNFAPNEDTGLQPVYGIGQFHPQEIVQTRYAGTFTFSKMVLSGDKATDIGWKETSGKSLKDTATAFLENAGFSIQIQDKYGEKQVIKTYHGCKIGSTGINVTENAIIVENGNGQFINCATPSVIK